MIRHWFFDLDGTLADTEADIRESWRQTLADLGLECPRFDELYTTGPTIDEVTRTLFPDLYGPDLVAKIRCGFQRHYDHDGFPNTRPYPGVIEAVRRLRAAGLQTYIATNKRYAATQTMVRHFGWDCFTRVYSSDMYADGPLGKLRKPQLLAHALEENGIDAREAAMVGDTRNDFEAARFNGVVSVAVPWGYGSAEELALADLRWEDCAALRDS